MKLLIKIILSLLVGAVCVWFVVRHMDTAATVKALRGLSLSAILLYTATLAVTHLFRAWRWRYLLRPVGVTVPFGTLMKISTVGFMAILALPVRLGEFVRPYFVVRGGQSRMSTVLGTVAVERIVDGLLISVLFFASYLTSPPNSYPPGLRFAAWLSLAGFIGLTGFLGCALRWKDATIRLALTVTLLNRLAPRLAHRIDDKLRALIQGFAALAQPEHLVPFLVQSLLYWSSNGFGMWILARSMHLDISLPAAYAVMAFTGVLISLPNAPGLAGQFHAGVLAGLSAYVGNEQLRSYGTAYAIALHGIQFAWYIGAGLAALHFVGGATALRKVVRESNLAMADGGAPGK